MRYCLKCGEQLESSFKSIECDSCGLIFWQSDFEWKYIMGWHNDPYKGWMTNILPNGVLLIFNEDEA